LLVSNATQIYQFCYACHDNAAQGADTNVEGGVYKGNLAGNTHGGALNGGFFGSTNASGAVRTSDHIVSGGWGAYGGGQYGQGLTGATGDIIGQQVGAGNTITMTCASCHDPHGSSNYRLLADKVNGNTVGGYDAGDLPLPWVVSNEVGYPNGWNGPGGATGAGQEGWLKHQAGNYQMNGGGGGWPGYHPSYTTPKYAMAPSDSTPATDHAVARGMSGWCAGCHSVYMQTGTPHSTDSSYNAGDGWGYQSRHRHPMNVSMASSYGALTVTITPAAVDLPLAHTPDVAGTTTNDGADWIDCMTCHVAHGASSDMTGYANVKDATNIEPNSGTTVSGGITKRGVAPTGDSALLRMNNRGVCEECHNK
jgi:cytochrome c553